MRCLAAMIMAVSLLMLSPVWAEEGGVFDDMSAADVPQQMEGFNLVGYSDRGEKAWDIKGDKADIMGNEVDVTNVDANSYGEEDVNLKAKNAKLNKTTGNVFLQKDVVITTERGAVMSTDTLQWDRKEDLVHTKDAVTLQDESMRVQGQGMQAHPGLRSAILQKDVTADIAAVTEDKRRENRIQITSDGPMEVDQAAQRAVFTDNVMAIEAATDRTLRADRMEVLFDERTKKVKEIVCTGNVEVQQGQNITYSDMLIYKADEQRMVLKGRPKLILDTGDHTMADALQF